MEEKLIVDFRVLFGFILDILYFALIFYIAVKIIVFIIGLILKPIYKKRLLPDSKVKETKKKVFKYLYLSLMILSVILLIYKHIYY